MVKLEPKPYPEINVTGFLWFAKGIKEVKVLVQNALQWQCERYLHCPPVSVGR